ncbi:MAG: biotin synthase BioB [Deltaproteobacteria bacterium]|nr:biotin synthase BioB [Deltaproteobacteria bacterium]
MDLIDKLQRQALKGKGIGAAEALELFVKGAAAPFRVLAAASEIREHFKGKAIVFCVISNAKSGRCSEDCAFCAQSSHYKTAAQTYPLKEPGLIAEEARAAAQAGAEWFGIVTSGKRIAGKREWAKIYKAIEGIKAAGLFPCASLGIIDGPQATALKAAGLARYHHNLETARSYFPRICTTHDYEEDVDSVRAAQAAGLTVCSGGLMGLGEGISHRIEMAETLRELDVDSIPLNILTPIKGTPLGQALPLPPLEILLTIAVYRFMLPDKEIKLCGGKEKNLRQLLPLGLVAGANSLMTGNYLTTTGRDSGLDREMVLDLNLVPTRKTRLQCTCEGAFATSLSAPPQTRRGKKR